MSIETLKSIEAEIGRPLTPDEIVAVRVGYATAVKDYAEMHKRIIQEMTKTLAFEAEDEPTTGFAE